jgi:hypothetical protein
MIKKTTIQDGIFIVLLSTLFHFLFSKYGFNPTDEGFVLSSTNRVLHGQIPHVDFSSLRPLGYAYLHIPELLFSDKHILLISRFVFWLEQTLIAFLWIRLVLNFTKTKIAAINKYLLIILCLILNVHYFPCSVLHTIDGLLMCLAGLNIIISEKKYNISGFLFIGFAALCKQNFLAVLPFALLFSERKNYVKDILISLLPIAIYIIIICCFGGFANLKAQLFTHHEIFSIGVFSYIKSHMFYAGILLAIVSLFIQNNNFKILIILILNVVCMYSIATNRYHEKFGFLIFGATLGFSLIPLLRKQSAFTKLFFMAVILAWCVSISLGYNSPALFLGGCITLILLYISAISNNINKNLSAYLLIILIPLSFIFYYVRTNLIYRDAPARLLIYKLDDLVESANGIHTNLNTFKVLVELDILKKKYPGIIVLPDFTYCNLLHSQQSKIGTEWPNKTEIPNQQILNFVIRKFVNDTSYVLIPKYNIAMLSSGFYKVPESKSNDFLILQYIFTHYKKKDEYSYFDLYKK